MKRINPILWSVAGPLLFVGAATSLKSAFSDVIGRDLPFLLYFLAIAASAGLSGARAGFVATGLSMLASGYLFLPPYRSLTLADPAVLARLLVFGAEACLMSLAIGAVLGARRRAEQAADQARRAESALATTLHSIGDAVIATNASGEVTIMNPIAERLTGWQRDEARGRPLGDVFQIVNERTREEVESPVPKVIREGTVVGLANHTLLLGRGGGETPIDDSGAPIRDEEGRLSGVVLVFRDVTAKKREEESRELLHEAGDALASSLDYKSTLSMIVRLAVPRLADWCAVDVVEEGSAAATQLAVAHVDPTRVAMAIELGQRYPADPGAKIGVPQVIRTGKAEMYPEIPDDLLVAGARDDEHLRILRELRLESAMVVPLVARERTLGAITFIHAGSRRRYGRQDLAFAEELARRAALAMDNARLYAAERSARAIADAANRMKDEFLSTLSHELRTPLNAMLGWIRLLQSGKLEASKQARGLEVINRNVVAQAQLIEDLLDVSRIVSGKLRLDIDRVNVGAVIEAAVDSVKPAMDAKHLRFQAIVDPTLAPILADARRLQQIVWNLLGNAIKFTPQGGSIKLTLLRRDAHIVLAVADSGPGISRELLPHIFERFRQADSSITRAHGGLGLGLAICRHIAELHGGTIEAESRGEGEGAKFTVHLPIASAHERGPAKPASGLTPAPVAPDLPASLSGLKVLVVDDDPDTREVLAAVITKANGAPIAVGSAAEALDAMERDPPDVLLSDIGMPGMDGYELIRRVRALEPDKGRRIPAAAFTAYTQAEDRRKALEAGYQIHLPKPVEPAQLIAALERLMSMSQPAE